MKRFSKQLLAGIVTAGLAMPMTAFATNGYFAHGYGTKNKGLAGGGAALPQDAMIAASNPAGMVFVDDQINFGAALFSPSPRQYKVSGNPLGMALPLSQGTVESNNDYFVIPHFAYNHMIDSNNSVGITLYGNGGMNTRYDKNDANVGPFPGTFGAGDTGVNLEQLFVAATYAHKFTPDFSVGVTPIFAVQRFKAEGLASFAPFSNDPSNLSDNGHEFSTGFGGKLGLMGKVTPTLALAGSYQSKMYMDEFDDYAGLFAEKGDFDIPATATVGLAWEAKPKMFLTFDVQHIWYSEVDSIANEFADLFSCPAFGGSDGSKCLGGSNGGGFGWDDMTIFKLGFQWETSPQWTWRLGASYGEQPIDDSEVLFNIIAPAVMEQHYTAGFTRNIGADQALDLAVMYAPKEDQSGPNPLDPGQRIKLEMTQYEVELSYTWKF